MDVHILAVDKEERHKIKKRLTEKFPDYEVGETEDTRFLTYGDRAFYTVTVDVSDRETARNVGDFVADRFGSKVNVEDGRR